MDSPITSERSETTLVPADELEDLVRRLLIAARVSEEIAQGTARGLVWTSLRGIDSHGVRLLPHYLQGVRGGRLNPNPNMRFEATSGSTGILDADHTFGHAAGLQAMRHAIHLARTNGIGAVAVRNSSHCGALSFFGHEAALEDMIGVAFTHATARVKSPGSNRPFFGNNPICVVAPMADEDPFCFDAATTRTTFNAVKAAAEAGRTLPPGSVADIEGRETIDPLKAHQLIPIGDYKGFGLSMMVDILCALLSGMPSGNHVSQMFGAPMSEKRRLGHFFCAINIAAFRDTDVFKQDLQDLALRVRAEPAIAPGERAVMVPGDPEKQIWSTRVRKGIPLATKELAALKALEGSC